MLGMEDDRPLVSWIGRLEPEKRPLLALRAAELNLRRHPEVRYVFAGDGRLRGDMTEFIAAHGLGDAVTMLGPIEDVEHLLADSRFLLLTSEVEGFGLILVEAQAAGVPCIASLVGAVPEVVEPRYGITVPDEEDATGLADALEHGLSEGYDLAAASEQARRHSLKFSKERMLAEYLDLLG
jgi:glycosyltransferase involved in cell wall biosynthesis